MVISGLSRCTAIVEVNGGLCTSSDFLSYLKARVRRSSGEHEQHANASRNKNKTRRRAHVQTPPRSRRKRLPLPHLCHPLLLFLPGRFFVTREPPANPPVDTNGSPPAHLRGSDRRRGCSGLRDLHCPQLLLQAAGMVTAGGVLHHQRGETRRFTTFQADR